MKTQTVSHTFRFPDDPNLVRYPQSIQNNPRFVQLKTLNHLITHWSKNVGRTHLPIELGYLLRERIINQDRHNTIYMMLRSEDPESQFMALTILQKLKKKRLDVKRKNHYPTKKQKRNTNFNHGNSSIKKEE